MPSVGRQWRTLRQSGSDPSLIADAAIEFPGFEAAAATSPDRRRLLQLITAALATAELGGCAEGPDAHLIPAVKAPPDIVPALPNSYATANLVGGYASGIVVKHVMGRPIGVEGNRHHPASLGAADAFATAQLLDFYDPDRAAAITVRGVPSDRTQLMTALNSQRDRLTQNQGAGLRS